MVETAISVAKSAAQHLSKLAVDEAKYLYEVKSKVDELRDELLWMQAFLENANTRFENKDKLVKLWISQILDISYEAEDAVDKYIHGVPQKRKDGIVNSIKWFFFLPCNFRDAKTLHEVGSEIDALTRKNSKLTSRMQTYKITPTSTAEGSSSSTTPKRLARIDSHLSCIQESRRKLVRELKDPRTNRQVLVVWGTGGQGKSTLAKLVYDEDVANTGLFHRRVWVHVSQDQLDVNLIYRKMLLDLNADDKEETESIKELPDKDVASKLLSFLKKKKCFVVLDDVWTTSVLDAIKPGVSIMDGCTSKLFVTTRKIEIAHYFGDHAYVHQPELINSEGSYNLLVDIARKRGSPGNYMERAEELAEKFASACTGNPLAIILLTEILSREEDIKRWWSIYDSIKIDPIQKILEMSYCSLPTHLTHFLLYIAMFPANFKIRTKTLYQWWVAEGLASSTQHKSAEEVCEMYLSELVERYLVQVVAWNQKTGKMERVNLHDLIRDMCRLMVREDNFLSILSSNNFITPSSTAEADEHSTVWKYSASSIRRLGIHMNESLQDYCLEHDDIIFDWAPYLRSLFFFSIDGCQLKRMKGWIKRMSKSYRSLRVLVLDHAAGTIELPKEIGDFMHLRVLSLKGCDFGHKYRLPSSIGNLRSLQTLDLRTVGILIIPNVFPNLKQLMHLYFPKQHLAQRFDKLQLGSLIHLSTLKNLDLRQCRIEVLRKLKKLRRVVTVPKCLRKKDLPKLKCLLDNPRISSGSLTKNLELFIEAGIFNTDRGALSECPSLSRLVIRGKIVSEKVSSLKLLQNLRELELYGTEIELNAMLILEMLSKLEILRLKEGSCLAEELRYFSPNGFPQLTDLTISGLKNLRKWTVGGQVTCNLRRLKIINCIKLQSIPGSFPELTDLKLELLPELREWKVEAGSIPKLAELDICKCENLETIPKGFPDNIYIYCEPCVGGIEKYRSCPLYQERKHSSPEEESL